MKFNFFLNLSIIISVILFNGNNLVFGVNHNWVEVSKTAAGIQYLDRDSLNVKDEGTIEIITKYLKIDTNSLKKIEENIYVMRINCLTKEFKDISVNGKKILTSKWEAPKGDKLIDDVILDSCKNV